MFYSCSKGKGYHKTNSGAVAGTMITVPVANMMAAIFYTMIRAAVLIFLRKYLVFFAGHLNP